MFKHVIISTMACLATVHSFAPSTTQQLALKNTIQNRGLATQIYSEPTDRRDFVSKSLIAGVLSQILTAGSQNAIAADDLTSQMFNEDGSLKEGVIVGDAEAKDKKVELPFPSNSDSTEAIISVDGVVPVGSSESSGIKASYTVPDKWTAAPDYLDTLLSVQEKACDRIAVYQVPGVFKDNSVLDKATTIGVAKALGFSTIAKGTFPKTLPGADIVSGKKVSKAASSASDGEEKRKYYDFDMAVAPDSCGTSADNLGLGFCPYDTIVLLSATIIDGKMMVFGLTSTKDEWKRANADLKRVRNSFFVEKVS
jgi:hypothetical protein